MKGIYIFLMVLFYCIGSNAGLAQVEAESLNQQIQIQNKSEENYVTESDLIKELENLKSEVQEKSITSEKLYETLLDLKDEQVSMMDSNLSSIIGFSQIFLGVLSLVIAVGIGWIITKLREVKKLKKQVINIKSDVEKSLERAHSIEKIYSEIPADNFYFVNNLSKEDESSEGENASDDVDEKEAGEALSQSIVLSDEQNEENGFENEKNHDNVDDKGENEAIPHNVASQQEKKSDGLINHHQNKGNISTSHRLERGDLYMVDFGISLGSEFRGTLLAVVLQNDIGNRFSPLTIVAPISNTIRSSLPTHINIDINTLQGVVILEQMRTIDKQRLIRFVGSLDKNIQGTINDAIRISLGLRVL